MPTFFNQATLSYNDVTTTSNTVQGEIVQALTMTKTAATDNYAPGSTVTYAISIFNSSTAPFTELTLTDDLGNYPFGTADSRTPLTYLPGTVRYFINGVLQTPAPTVAATSPLTVTGLTVPAGANAMLIYNAEPNEFAPPAPGSNITNTASLAGGGLIDAVEATAAVTPADEPVLGITKAIEPATVTENGTITYTFTINNTGSQEADAADNVTVRDVFDPALNITAVTLNGGDMPANTAYTYTPANGTFATVPGTITVPAATYTQNPTTGAWNTTPGTATLTVTGTV